MTVLELITGRLARMLAGTVPVLTGLEAVNAAVNVIGLELVRRKSDLALQEISLSYAADDGTEALPAGFAGLVGHPVVVNGDELKRLPDLEAGLLLRESSGTPEYYDQQGANLLLYPAPDVDCVVKATAKIVPVLAVSDTLPWLERFNDLIAAAAAQLAQQGMTALAAPGFHSMIDKGVSAVLTPRMTDLPRQRPIHYF